MRFIEQGNNFITPEDTAWEGDNIYVFVKMWKSGEPLQLLPYHMKQ